MEDQDLIILLVQMTVEVDILKEKEKINKTNSYKLGSTQISYCLEM